MIYETERQLAPGSYHSTPMRLGQRTSVDFDFFSERPLPRDYLRNAWLVSSGKILQEEANTITFFATPGQSGTPGVKISLFGGVQTGRVGEPAWTDDGLVWVASLLDCLATKLKVIMQRAEAKDYQDIAKILETGLPLDRGLGAARAIFRSFFHPTKTGGVFPPWDRLPPSLGNERAGPSQPSQTGKLITQVDPLSSF